MPRMDKADDDDGLIKLMLIGDGMIGKTHYAGMAAMAGFNVLYIAGDVNRATLKKLPMEAKQRIYSISCADSMVDGARESTFYETYKALTVSGFKWNDTKGRLASQKDEVGDEIWTVKAGRMGPDCVLVLDSWTGLCESIMNSAALAHGVDIADASTAEMRPVYQSAALKTAQFLQMIRSVPCHMIVLAHTDEYVHYVNPTGKEVQKVKEGEKVIDWTKWIPKSTSRPQAMQMAKYFTDVGWMEMNASGTKRMINFRMSQNRIVGGHFDDLKDAEEYSFANLVKLLGGTIPDGKQSIDHWIQINIKQEAATPTAQVLDGTQATPIKTAAAGGFAGFLKK